MACKVDFDSFRLGAAAQVRPVNDCCQKYQPLID